MDLTIRTTTRLGEIDRDRWDALDHRPSPFLEHGFLAALEESGSVGSGSGWHPRYVAVERGGRLVGGTAAYVKTHSYGEYIFDFAWANAAARAGLAYFPKVVVAPPATPATGPRLLVDPSLDDDDRAQVQTAIIAAVDALAQRERASSVHWLFVSEEEHAVLARHGATARTSFQFHFRDRGCADFDGFLAQLSSRKRKQIRRERARALASVDAITWLEGDALSPARLARLERHYRSTVASHGGRAYLRPGFFARVAAHMPDRVRVLDAVIAGESVASALFFETPQALYGRYWGCDTPIEFLHFELAYYAGIERCLARGISLFEAGAQGEHKLLRGFLPALTYSNHRIEHPGLRAAIEDFLRHEDAAVRAHVRELSDYGPFRRGPRSEAAPRAAGENDAPQDDAQIAIAEASGDASGEASGDDSGAASGDASGEGSGEGSTDLE